MSLITTLENRLIDNYKKDYYLHLTLEKFLVEKHFNWLKIELKGKALFGNGILQIANKSYSIELIYSPFLPNRFDRIYIKDKSISYNRNIHLYRDLSLCLYHPVIDKPLFKIIPLYQMIPWISEWCVFYEEWKKYGIWLGKEIQH